MVLENQTTDSISSLPDNVWEIMASPKTTQFNIKLGEKYKLDMDKVQIIAIVEAGIFHKKFSIQQFPKLLNEKLAIDSETTKKLVNDINKKLFIPLKDYLGVLPHLSGIASPSNTQESIKKPSISKTNLSWTKKISPYEKKREIISRPNRKAEPKKTSKIPIPEIKKEEIRIPPQSKEVNEYQIRTMKQDIEKARKQSTLSEGNKNNIVDLSGK